MSEIGKQLKQKQSITIATPGDPFPMFVDTVLNYTGAVKEVQKVLTPT